MSYQTRLDAAIAAISDHNDSVGDDANKINCDTFVANLKKMGGTSEAALASCTWEDLEHCGLPRILARSVSGIFRDKVANEPEKIVIVDDDPTKRAARLKPEELVAEYDLEDPHNPYGKRLQDLKLPNFAPLSSVKFIIIEDGKVNVPATQKELRRLLDGYNGRDQVNVEGRICKTYLLGERPNRYVHQHCVLRTPLDGDGCSDKGVAWGKLEMPVQQLLYLAVDTKELPNYEEFDLFDMVSGKSFGHLAERYPEAAVKFTELENLGDLPRLVVQMGGSNGGGVKPNQPFGQNRTT